MTDNADPATVFQKRLPALDYDLTMLITSATADPSVTWAMAGDQIPTAEHSFQGANSSGWCNEEAGELMKQSDAELDPTKRTALVNKADAIMALNVPTLPLVQKPTFLVYKTKIKGIRDNSTLQGPTDNMEDWWVS